MRQLNLITLAYSTKFISRHGVAETMKKIYQCIIEFIVR